MKRILTLVLAATLLLFAFACATDSPSPSPSPGGNNEPSPGGNNEPSPVDPEQREDVTLMLWGGEEDQVMLRLMADEFIAANADYVNLTINIGIESESTLRDTVLTDPQAAADVFQMADDQLPSLVRAGALQEITLNTDAIRAANQGGSVAAASLDGRLFAYPMTADNGQILFYNSEFLTADDVKSWDRMAEVAAGLGKQVAMNMANGWWSIGFFRGANLDAWVEDDGSTGTTFNASGGTDVVQAMLDLAAKPGFVAMADGNHVGAMADGSVIAIVNGPWNAEPLAEVLGENYAAAKLPTFTMNGNQVQMGGVLGCKLVGVNAFSENVGWAMRLAEFLTNQENQIRRFEMREQGPSNIVAAASPAVSANAALAAIAEQAAFSSMMVVGDAYWGVADTLFEIIVQGNPDGTDLQTLLDNAAAGFGG
jgi:arabinogalactan oligomer/maltooligosaccharide transport system substrate-binding protein